MKIKPEKNVKVTSLLFEGIKKGEGNLEFGSRYFLYTNRLNLLLFLSSGIIHPNLSAEQNHFKDLSTFNSRGLILFKNYVSLNTLDLVKSKSYHSNICLEIILPQNLDGIFLFDEEYIARQGSLSDFTEKDIALFFPGCLGFSFVDRIVFQSEIERQSFLSDKHISQNICFDNFVFSTDARCFEGENYDPIIILKLSDSILVRESINGGNLSRLNKTASLLISYKIVLSKFFTHELFLDYYKLVTFFSESSNPDTLKSSYKHIKKEDLDYDEFNFSNSFLLLVNIIAINYSSGNFKIDYENFINDFVGKKKNADELIQYMLSFSVIYYVINWDPDDSDHQSQFIKFKDSLSQCIGNGKKSKKQLEEIVNALEVAAKIYNYEIDNTEIFKWPAYLNPLKYFILFSFNLGLENTLSFISKQTDSEITSNDRLWLISLSSMREGYDRLNMKYKKYQNHDMFIISDLIDNFSLGLNPAKQSFDVNYSEALIEKLGVPFSQKIIRASNGVEFGFVEELIIKKQNIWEIILDNPVPKDLSVFIELAIKLGWNDLIIFEIRFDLKSAHIDFKKSNQDETFLGRLLIRGKDQFKTQQLIKADEFISRIREEKLNLANTLIDTEIINKILSLYNQSEKKI